MRIFKTLLTLTVALLAIAPSHAVTDKEMDQAKAIAAKQYLRWVNDGSGYLDEFEVKSMSELNSKLKEKEKENLKAFNSVSVPGDYASWDKEKLVEFWSVTFFTSPLLEQKGKNAKASVKKKIQAMQVSAPAPKEEAKPEPPAPEPEPGAEPVTENVTNPDAMPTAEDAVNQEQDILNDQQAIADDAKLADESRHEEQSNTWVYVLVLAILIGVVIWLVVYAANVMKRQPTGEDERGRESGSASENESELRAQAKAAITKKNEEIDQLRQRLQKEESRAADLGMEIERLKLENSRLHQQIVKMREETTGKEIEREKTAVARQEAVKKVREETPAKLIKTIYLGRANQRGIFVRADRRITPGNTIYRLDTNDGLVGTFHVVDEPEVIDVALSDPGLYLATGCTGEDFEDTAGVTRIVTDSDGTAIFENGYWKVLRKTRIRYE